MTRTLSDAVLHIPPPRSADPRLKRGILHDPASRRYTLDTSGLNLVDVEWADHLPTLNQGNVGKCTSQAAAATLGSDPFFASLPADVQTALQTAADAWTDAFYGDEETLDGDGPFPPNDNGSYGLTSAKVAQARKLISGYQHTFTVDDALKGLQLYPACWGTLWKTGMDDVNEDTGQVTYSGATRGGHELCLYRVNVALEQVWFHQSWGAWGYQRSGVGWLSFDDFAASLQDQGDVTFYTPLTEPAPQPAPPPSPASGGVVKSFSAADRSFLDDWAARRHSTSNKTAATIWRDAAVVQ